MLILQVAPDKRKQGRGSTEEKRRNGKSFVQFVLGDESVEHWLERVAAKSDEDLQNAFGSIFV